MVDRNRPGPVTVTFGLLPPVTATTRTFNVPVREVGFLAADPATVRPDTWDARDDDAAMVAGVAVVGAGAAAVAAGTINVEAATETATADTSTDRITTTTPCRRGPGHRSRLTLHHPPPPQRPEHVPQTGDPSAPGRAKTVDSGKSCRFDVNGSFRS